MFSSFRQKLHDRKAYKKSDLMRAAEKGDLEEVRQRLQEGEPVDAASAKYGGFAALHFAAQQGHADVVRELIAAGADASKADEDGWTPLHWAVINVDSEAAGFSVVRCLVNAGCAIDAQNSAGNTALLLALCSRSMAAARFLIDRGADCKRGNRWHQSPLHVAARMNSVELLRSLLDHGAQLNTTDSEQRTPLHEAAHHGSSEAAIFLLDAGADFQLRSINGKTAAEMAIENNNPETVQLILNKQSLIKEPKIR